MEHFEQLAISSANKRPAHWYRYVDDTFVVWPHGKEELQEFLNTSTTSIPIEENRSLAFLDILVSRRPDGSLGHTVYRKPTHTDLYLRAKSEHHPAQKTVLTTLVQRARTICDANSLDAEINRLKKAFSQNGCSDRDIKQAVHHKKKKPPSQQEKPTGVAMLSYQLSVSNKISRLLNKYNIKTVHIAARKSMHLLRPAKDNLGQMVAGMYCIPCECGRVYVRQTPAEPSSPGARNT
jgi:hypothetical protein